MSSIFSQIISREIPADIVYEDERIIAFKDIKPEAPVHILVVPKEQISTLNLLKEEHKLLIGEIFLVIQKLAKEFNIDQDGYRVVSNCNQYGGQTVYHIHFHLLGGRRLGKMG